MLLFQGADPDGKEIKEEKWKKISSHSDSQGL